MYVEKQNTDFQDVDTAQRIVRDGQSGLLELERAAQILDGEVDRLSSELDAARTRYDRVHDRLADALENWNGAPGVQAARAVIEDIVRNGEKGES